MSFNAEIQITKDLKSMEYQLREGRKRLSTPGGKCQGAAFGGGNKNIKNGNRSPRCFAMSNEV